MKRTVGQRGMSFVNLKSYISNLPVLNLNAFLTTKYKKKLSYIRCRIHVFFHFKF